MDICLPHHLHAGTTAQAARAQVIQGAYRSAAARRAVTRPEDVTVLEEA